MALALSLTLAALSSVALGVSPGPYEGQSVHRVWPRGADEAAELISVAIERWDEAGGGGWMDLRLDADGVAAIGAMGTPSERLVPDLQAVADADQARRSQRASPAQLDLRNADAFFDEFRPLAEIEAFELSLQENYPDLITRVEIGQSYEGRPIYALEFDPPGLDPNAPTLVLNSVQHAREWLAGASTVCVAASLAQGWDEDPAIAAQLQSTRWRVVPVVNPDGYVHTWGEERFWRKNRSPEFGVDLNRNWPEGWGVEPGSSGDPESNNYRGEEPLSEPETFALAEYLEAQPRLRGHVDIHAYGQLVLFPLSYVDSDHRPIARLRGWATEMAEIMSSVNDVDHVPLYGLDFYPAAGVLQDWAYGGGSVAAFTIEVRPASGSQENFLDGFAPEPAEIRPTCEENLAAFLALSAWLSEGGPDPIWPEEGGETGESDSTGGSDIGEDDGLGETSDSGGGEGDGEGGSDGEGDGATAGQDNGGSGEAGLDPESSSGCACRAVGTSFAASRGTSWGPTPWAFALMFAFGRRRGSSSSLVGTRPERQP